MDMYVHLMIHAYIHTYVHICKHVWTHILYKYIDTCICICINVCIYIYISGQMYYKDPELVGAIKRLPSYPPPPDKLTWKLIRSPI